MDDATYMRRALQLARKGLGWTSPNPAVGALVVREGKVAGEGYHRKAGGRHAEVFALEQAGELARGATIYVTLEPCNHYGRTPPCTRALLNAGIRRAVIATADANPSVRGRGLLELFDAGLDVVVGVERLEARKINERFAKFITTGLPWVTLKMAVSLDGKVATRTGDSRWITGPEARAMVHTLRHQHDGVLVGLETVIADNPRLTVRLSQGRDPVRVVLDSHLRIPLEAGLVSAEQSASTIIVTTPDHDADRRRELESRGVQVLVVSMDNGRVSLRAALRALGQIGITSLLVEGGAAVNAAFLEAGLADKILAFTAPKIIGGSRAPGAVGGHGPERVSQALRLSGVSIEWFGPDWMVSAYPEGRGPDTYWDGLPDRVPGSRP